MYSKGIAYFLWLISGCGALGFHRFYLGKLGTGLIWFCTGGLGMVGSIYDLITLGSQVDEENMKKRYQVASQAGWLDEPVERNSYRTAASSKSSADPEYVILKVAKSNAGMVTPSEVALEANISLDEAKKHLEALTSKGHAEMRVNKNGTIVYIIPDFRKDASSSQFEDL